MRDYAPKTLRGISKQVAKDVYKKVGNKIAKDMTNEYKMAIRSFYNDYHPTKYKRLYRSYFFPNIDGTRNYTKFVKMDSNNQGFSISLKLDPKNIKVPYSSISTGKSSRYLTSLVFINTWVKGQHGGRLPWDILPEDNRPFDLSNRWESFNNTMYWQPPTMSNPPMSQMDTWFSNYATNDNLNKMTQTIITNSINRYIRRAQSRYGGVKD